MASNPRDVWLCQRGEGETANTANGDAGRTRMESSFDADGIRVRVSIKRLDDDERTRVAAEVAWFTDLLSTPGVDVEASGWMLLVQRMINDVAITVDDDVVERLQPMWGLVLSRALRAYIDANGLDASLNQCLHGRLPGLLTQLSKEN